MGYHWSVLPGRKVNKVLQVLPVKPAPKDLLVQREPQALLAQPVNQDLLELRDLQELMEPTAKPY